MAGSHWNYRVRDRGLVPTVPGCEPERVFDLVEVYYDKHDKINGYGEVHDLSGETVAELRDDLERIRDATYKPALTEEELSGA